MKNENVGDIVRRFCTVRGTVLNLSRDWRWGSLLASGSSTGSSTGSNSNLLALVNQELGSRDLSK